MNKQNFKNKVLEWLSGEKIDLKGKRIRVYKYRGEWEVRIYNEPMEMDNNKRSTRKVPEWTDDEGKTWNAMSGKFSQMISTYTHINETDLKSEEEKKFILEMLDPKRI